MQAQASAPEARDRAIYMERWIELKGREKRHKRIRRKIIGTSVRPRLSVRRSINHLYTQIIDDAAGKTLLEVSTLSKDLKDKISKDAGNVKGAAVLGRILAEKCKKEGITKVVFDRAGYLYHGRIKTLAEAARKGGLSF